VHGGEHAKELEPGLEARPISNKIGM